MIENLSQYGLAFLISMVKFSFAASIVTATTPLSPFLVAISTGLGAIASFNIFYWSSNFFMKRAKEKQEKAIAEGTYKRKISFTKLNKFMVKTKMSKSGFWIICTLAPLIISIPLGTIIVAKFYREKALTYPVAVISLIVWAFVLAYLNGAIFSMFKQ
jgi:hypothetical protein